MNLAAPFAMTKVRVLALRRYVHGRKGLDEPTYRMHLSAVGADSTLHLTSTQYDALLARLRPLPDRERREKATAGARA
ncbi:hypothetical protein [Luteimonas terrae]|uniref:Uncharacterized protein n=1 Tax=Luteimonas terrae TaxID=1530191 RepID=A0ABU1XX97_9GAMM|nr:hypothetical protein [Luteimonas terrae]MDR7193394.1 hypothetical protein [Luteimonas terrae]